MIGNDDIIPRLKKIIQERFGLDIGAADGNSRLKELGIDSLHAADVMFDVEQEFGFQFQDLSLPPNPSLGEMSAAILQNLDGVGPPGAGSAHRG